MAVQEKIETIFNKVDDPRSARNQKHPFHSLLGITLLGALAGIDNFSALAEYAQMHFHVLSTIFPLPHGVPSHDTFQRLLGAMNPEQFHTCFIEFTQTLQKEDASLVAIDGKTVRNSGKNPLHLVNAWCEQNELVLGQMAVNQKSNEIKAIPKLLALLDLQDRVVTIDAMGCQQAIAKQIKEQGGDYVLSLKGNQKTFHETVKQIFSPSAKAKAQQWEEWDKGHGRTEHRKCYTLPAPAWLIEDHPWLGLKSIAVVESKRIVGDKQEESVHYYISSLSPEAERICRTARKHWSIENKLHWRLDVVYNEDKAHISNEHSAENMSLVRKLAMNILNQQKGKSSMKSLQRKSMMSCNYAMNLLRAA